MSEIFKISVILRYVLSVKEKKTHQIFFVLLIPKVCIAELPIMFI